MPTRWGILGCGKIARKFAEGLVSAKDARLVAVGSRTRENAERFGAEFGVPRLHTGYQALAEDRDVDVVYVATPHPGHKENAIRCLRAGRAVLCEKPFAVNAREAQEMIDVARGEGRFLMEAMWSRFLPSLARLRELLDQGIVGEVRMVQADFGFRLPWNPESRLLDPALAGGGLLDVGVYTVSLASWVLRKAPTGVCALADIGTTGVDEQAAIVLSHDAGELALLACGVRTRTPHEATILGTEGYIRLHGPWWQGAPMTVHRGEEVERIDLPISGNGYNYEAEEVGRCLADGRTESAVMPLDETAEIMRTLDRVRAGWGLRFPTEREGAGS